MRAREFIMERPPEFKGSVCTKDCSGHTAGYLWALKNGLKALPKFPEYVHPSFRKGAAIAAGELDRAGWNKNVQTRQTQRATARQGVIPPKV